MCCLHVAGARLSFGGKELQNHTVPKVYGAIEPTAVFVPLKEILKDDDTFETVTTEVFGPLQVCPKADNVHVQLQCTCRTQSTIVTDCSTNLAESSTNVAAHM